MTATPPDLTLFPDMKRDAVSLVDRFDVPPLSVLDRRSGYWQEMRRRWLALGISPAEGRDGALVHDCDLRSDDFSQRLAASDRRGGTSLFDPALAAIAVRWYSPAGGHVYDPFAGGSVRGLVSGILGRSYVGVDVRAEQVDANDSQAESMDVEMVRPTWLVGDGTCAAPTSGADLVLTCPPYFDLERYSDLPHDLSAMSDADFRTAYAIAIRRSVEALGPSGFSVWVVGNALDGRGRVKDLVSLTVGAHHDAGAHLHSDAVVIDPAGHAAMRASRTFPRSRRLTRTHQSFLVFCKGDPAAAARRCEPFPDRQLLPHEVES